LLSVLLSFLLLSNWFLFLSSFVFPLLFRYCFIPISLAHVVSTLAYPNLLGTKRLSCCCCCCISSILSFAFCSDRTTWSHSLFRWFWKILVKRNGYHVISTRSIILNTFLDPVTCTALLKLNSTQSSIARSSMEHRFNLSLPSARII
jgi:hypothetical protein